MFSSLTLPAAIGKKSLDNQTHRGVVYLFQLQEDAACESKFLMDLN